MRPPDLLLKDQAMVLPVDKFMLLNLRQRQRPFGEDRPKFRQPKSPPDDEFVDIVREAEQLDDGHE